MENKGVDVLLKAFALLNNNTLPLKLVGEGEKFHQYKNMAENLGIASKVQWLGYQSGTDLDNLYRECRVLINPSQLNETFGLTCIEAFSKGRPVIASRIGALEEVVDQEGNGLLCQPGDPNDLALMMEKLSNGTVDPLQLGLNGYKKVKEKLNQENHYNALLDIYNEVVGSNEYQKGKTFN